MWADQIRRDGVVRWAYGAAARSLIHERDIAAVAVRTLTENGHGGAKHVVTGPELTTQAEQVRAIGDAIGDAIGRPVRWEEIPPDALRDGLAAFGDASFADHALDSWARFVDEPELVTSTVEKLTGMPAHTFREWATDHADDFRLAEGLYPPIRGVSPITCCSRSRSSSSPSTPSSPSTSSVC